MNAPVSEVRLAEGTLEWLPLGSIAPSETPSQARRRKRYTPERLAELAASIKSVGVMQPVIVRKLDALRGLAAYELVAGERRWLGAEQAGSAHIPAIVRQIADADLVAFQLVENKQRESIEPLEEAEAIQDLMKDKGLDAEAVGKLIGASRAHVYNRLKLLKLQPAVLDALDAGRIDHTKALQIARIPAAKLQRKALEMAVDVDHRGNQISHREFAERLRERLMVRLDGAPFDLADCNMLTKKPRQFACQESHSRNLPACTACQNFSGIDPEFDHEIETAYGDGASVCSDKPCHDHKVLFFFDQKLDRARVDGRTIIEGEQAKVIKPWPHSSELRGYIDLDAPAHEIEPPADLPDDQANDWEPPTYREVLKEHAALEGAAILVDPHNGQPRDVLPAKVAAKALKKAAGVELNASAALEPRSDMPADRTGRPAATVDHEELRREQDKQQAREQLERAFRRKILDAVHAKWKGPLKRDELATIAGWVLNIYDQSEVAAIDWYYGGQVNLAKMNERELGRLLLATALCNSTEYLGDSPAPLLALAKRMKIDAAKVRKQAKAELGGEPEAEEKAQPKKKAKKK